MGSCPGITATPMERAEGEPETLLSEIVDTQIQLLTTLAYAGFDEQGLINGVITKLNAHRPDWKP